jgi:hypothetical protein
MYGGATRSDVAKWRGSFVVTAVDKSPGELRCEPTSLPAPIVPIEDGNSHEPNHRRTAAARDYVRAHMSSPWFRSLDKDAQIAELRNLAEAWIVIAAQHLANQEFYLERFRSVSKRQNACLHQCKCTKCGEVWMTGDAFHHVSEHGPCGYCGHKVFEITCPEHCSEVRELRAKALIFR